MFQSKLPDLGTTIFTVMSQLALEYKAINLGQGFPDFPMSENLISLVHKSMSNGNNQYAHTNGLPQLREVLAKKMNKLYTQNINDDTEITITPGGTYAIYTALTTILHPGDEVIVFEPAFDSYIPNIEINGAKPVLIPLQFPNFSIPWQKVKEHITDKTKAIIINSPHNPTGMVISKNDIEELQNLIQNNDIYIISDEVYEHIIFDDIAHESIMKYPDLFAKSFVCFSFGKTYHCTGWKLGYCVAPSGLMIENRKVHQFNCFTCNSAIQPALAEFIREEEAYLNLGNFLQQKRDLLVEMMAQTRFKPLPSYGSYFQCYSYEAISEENELDFAKRLVVEAGVATIPLSSFYKNGQENKVLRFCFAKKEKTLYTAVQNLIPL